MLNLLKSLCFLFLLGLAGCSDREAAAPTVDAAPYADLVLVNGYIYTADSRRTVAQAVAVRDGIISAVGSDDEVRRLQGPDTEVIDLAGGEVPLRAWELEDDAVWDLAAVPEAAPTRPAAPRRIAGVEVGPVGLGCMRLSTREDRPTDAVAVIHGIIARNCAPTCSIGCAAPRSPGV